MLDIGDLQIYRYRDDHDVNTVGHFPHELLVSDINSENPEVNVVTIEDDEDDPSEEWSTYLNSPEYVSQEESYAPTDQFKDMSL